MRGSAAACAAINSGSAGASDSLFRSLLQGLLIIDAGSRVAGGGALADGDAAEGLAGLAGSFSPPLVSPPQGEEERGSQRTRRRVGPEGGCAQRQPRRTPRRPVLLSGRGWGEPSEPGKRRLRLVRCRP